MENSTPSPASEWRLRTTTLRFGTLPTVMGILNVTPDSFSDGGLFEDHEAAVSHGLQLINEGADIVDIGGESTRPNAPAVPEQEELERTIPVIEALTSRTDTPISIDTSKAAVAAATIAAGAQILNDVTGLESDPGIVSVASATEVGVCVMHMQGTPRTMQDNPVYDDVVEDVFEYLDGRRGALVAAGVEPTRIAIDPGIGFGKTVEHNLELIRRADRFHEIGATVIVGHSRKSFIGKVLGDVRVDRVAGTVGVSLALARRRVQILRVHDVAATKHALTLFEAAGGTI